MRFLVRAASVRPADRRKPVPRLSNVETPSIYCAVFEDYVEMIRATRPDLVAICTAACLPKPARSCPDPLSRPDAHADMCVAVSNLGVPMIFCEKAIASSIDRLDEITAAFQRNGTKLATGQFRRYDRRFEVIRDAIAAGKIGDPTGAVFFGRSSLMHGHVHTIDTLHFLLGDPGIARVRGELHGLRPDSFQRNNHLADDPEATYELEFKNGVRAAAVVTGRGASYEFEVIGTEGRIRCWHQLGSESVVRTITSVACMFQVHCTRRLGTCGRDNTDFVSAMRFCRALRGTACHWYAMVPRAWTATCSSALLWLHHPSQTVEARPSSV